MNKEKRFSGRGTVAAVTTAAALVLVIVLNIIVGQLPSHILELDISENSLYSVSQESRDVLASLSSDIELIMICSKASADQRIVKFVEGYAADSGRIKLSYVDPTLTPSVLTAYECQADTLVVKNSVTGKFKAIPFAGYSDSIVIYAMDYSTYSYAESEFDADGQITAAINYVTSGAQHVIYALSGHQEYELGGSATSLLTKNNFDVRTGLELLVEGGVPSDCGLLIINDPVADLADDELKILTDYIDRGGKLLILMDVTDLPNFNSLLAYCGMAVRPGYVGDSGSYYKQYESYYGYFCFAPTLSPDSEVTEGITENLLLLYAHDIVLTDSETGDVKTEAFMYTTENGVHYADQDETVEYGRYIVGAAGEKTTGPARGRMTVLTSVSLIDDAVASAFTNMANLDLFLAAVSSNFENVSTVNIDPVSLTLSLNTMSGHYFFGLLYIVVIPLAILIGGLVYWSRRRKR